MTTYFVSSILGSNRNAGTSSSAPLANLQAAEYQHMAKAITPRLQRRDEKLNEQLIPLYDPSGRLFLASQDPVPIDSQATIAQFASPPTSR